MRRWVCLATHAVAKVWSVTQAGARRRGPSRARGWTVSVLVGVLGLATNAFTADLSQVLTIIASTPEGSWVQVNQNRLQDVWPPAALRLSSQVQGNNLGAIIDRQGAFVWDSNRGDLLLHGGGNGSYGGNEVYRWRASTQQWERASLPSQVHIVRLPTKVWHAFAADGPENAPAAAAPYDTSLFLPRLDRMLTFGGDTYYYGPYRKQTGPSTVIPTGPYLFDPQKADPNKVGGTTGSGVDPKTPGGQMWQNRDTYVTASGTIKPDNFAAGLAAYAMENGQEVVYIAGRANFSTAAHLYRYTMPNLATPTQDTWERVGYAWHGVSASGAGAYDPQARVFVRTGQQGVGPFLYWDLHNAGPLNRDVVIQPTDLSGGQFPGNTQLAGIEYDPVGDQFLLWPGGPEVWALRKPPGSLAAAGWTLQRHSSSNPTGPGGVNAAPGGVLGKWHYAADLGVFVGLRGATTGEVWFYKPRGWKRPIVGPGTPVAQADIATTATNTPVTITVLANDSDPQGYTLTVTGVTPGAHGTTAYTPTGTVTYTPAANYAGPDGFTYTVSNGRGGSATATVTVTVTQANRPPVAGHDTYSATAGTSLNIARPGVLGNDTDADGQALTAILVSGPTAGSVTLQANGSFVYTPKRTFSGTDSFRYQAHDGVTTSTPATVTITVAPLNVAPVAQPDAYSMDAHTVLTVQTPGVLGNDTDANGDALTAAVLTEPSHGVLKLQANGALTYTPESQFQGVDSFSYRASDGRLVSNTVTVTLTVTSVRTNPVLAVLAGIPDGSWVQVNQNRLQDVWTPKGLRLSYTHLGDNLSGIIRAWSSFAWDSNRGDLILYGGGHANYGGNDVYRWRSASLLWERAALPSQITPVPGILYGMPVDGADHAPASMHTYDNNLFLPLMDRMLTFGGAAFSSGAAYLKQTAPNTFINTGPYLFDPMKADPHKVGGTTGSGVNPLTLGGQMWHNRDTYVTGQGDLKPTSFVAGMTAYAVENGHEVVYVAGRANFSTSAHLYRYTIRSLSDPSQDTWERVGYSWTTVSAEGTGAYDPKARVFVRTGQTGIGPFVYWDLNKASPSNRDEAIHPTDSSGGLFPRDISGTYGLDFDPIREQFLLWSGGSEVWTLRKPAGAVTATGWTVHREAPPTIPGPGFSDSAGGVLGKWHYAPDLDAFVALRNSDDGEVWLYKPHGWKAPQPPLP